MARARAPRARRDRLRTFHFDKMNQHESGELGRASLQQGRRQDDFSGGGKRFEVMKVAYLLGAIILFNFHYL